jgi:nucleotide-binding universal stress UspA family protein
MLTLDRLLFATDGSAGAARAFRHAGTWVDRTRAELHAVHVDGPPADFGHVVDVDPADVLSRFHRAAEPVGAVAAPRTVERVVRHAPPAAGILCYAAEHDTGAIVLGTRGRRRAAGLGSVAAEVVHRTDLPVLTLPPDEGAPDGVDRILVAVDFSEGTDALLAHAVELAFVYDADLTLLHVVPPEVLPPYASSDAANGRNEKATRRRVQDRLAERAERVRGAGARADTSVRHGDPAAELLAAAEAAGGPLVAMLAHGPAAGDEGALGSTAGRVVRRAPGPVFTLDPTGRSLVAAPAAPGAASGGRAGGAGRTLPFLDSPPSRPSHV